MRSAPKWSDLMSKLSVIAYDIGKITLNGERHKAERFTLGNLNESQRQWLNGFSNVKISECSYRYAPEMKHPVVYIIH